MTAGGQNVRVIVVDDQFPFRDAARAVVDRTDGFEVIAEADSGEAAIELVAELHPDLVLMDIKMGGIDGIAATAAITSSDTHPMVVLLSTYELNDLPPAARTSGAAAYVNKDDFGGRVLRRLWEQRGDPSFART
jgi:DNA-binding NarL/FixJ family response regulator